MSSLTSTSPLPPLLSLGPASRLRLETAFFGAVDDIFLTDKIFCRLSPLLFNASSTGSCKRNLAMFSEQSSMWAVGLCNGCLGQWAEVRRENSNMLKLFCMTLYMEVQN